MKYLIFLAVMLGFSTFAGAHAANRAPCVAHAEMEFLDERPDYCVYRGEIVKADPVTHLPRTIPYRYYFSRAASPKAPLVLVYPSLSTEIPIVETQLSKKLVSRGYHAIIVELVEDIADLERPPIQINDFFIRSNWGSSVLLDLVQSWPEVDANNLNAVGVSLGGIRATIAYGSDRRLKRLIGYVTGGDLPKIFARTRVKLMRDYKAFWKTKLGVPTDDAFAKYLASILKFDPLETARTRSGNNVYFVLGRSDVKVPYAEQLKLLRAFGTPAHRIGPYGHRITGASFLVRFGEVVTALERPVVFNLP